MSLLFGDLFSLGPGVDLFDVGAGNLYELGVPSPCPDSSGLLFGDLFCASGTDLFQIDPSTNVFDLDAPVVPCNSEDYLFGDLFCLGDGSDLFDIGDTNVFLLGEDEERPHHGGNGGKRRRWGYEDDELHMLRLRADDEALLLTVFAMVETLEENDGWVLSLTV